MLRIAILSDLETALHINAADARSAYTYEFAAAMLQSAGDTGGIAADVLASSDSVCRFPFLAVERDPPDKIPADVLTRYAYQETVWLQLVLSGALDNYQIVHCLAPVVTPLYLLIAKGIPVVQTLMVGPVHPSSYLCASLLDRPMRRVQIGPYHISPQQSFIPPCVDLQEWCPVDRPATAEKQDYIFRVGKKGDDGEREARQIAGELQIPLFSADDGDPAILIRTASLVLDLGASSVLCGYPWLIRALACGIPIAAWESKGTKALFRHPGLGAFAPAGEWRLLAENIGKLLADDPYMGMAVRREYAMGFFGQRALAARYREVYKLLLTP